MPTASGISAQFVMAKEVYTNEVQQISGTPSAVFSLIFDGAQTTVGGLATNAAAAAVQAALEALPNIGTGGVVCAGGVLPAAITITFSGALVAGRNVPQITVQTGITGLTVATNTAGTGYGDGATPTRALEIVDESVKLDIARIEAKSLRSASRTQRSDRWAPGKRQAGGDLTFELGSKGFAMLLGQAFGLDTVITTPSGGSLTRDHSFAIVAQDTSNRSFTAQIGIPDVTGSATNVRAFTYNGCKVTDWEFTLDLDGILMMKLGIDAMDETTATALATATYASSFEVFYWTGAQVSLGGGNIDVRKFSIKGSTGLNQDRFFLRNSNLKKQPIAKDFYDITGSLEIELSSLTEYTRYVAGTTTSLTILVEGSTIEAITGETGKYGMKFTLPVVRFEGETPDLNGMDIVPVTLPFKALYDGTNPICTARYRTTDVAE